MKLGILRKFMERYPDFLKSPYVRELILSLGKWQLQEKQNHINSLKAFMSVFSFCTWKAVFQFCRQLLLSPNSNMLQHAT